MTLISGYILRWGAVSQSIYLSHGYLTGDFMKTAIVPIIKNKTKDSSN